VIPAVLATAVAWQVRKHLHQLLFSLGFILAAVVMSLNGVPPEYESFGRYTVIFSGILPRSTSPAADLAILGLEPSDTRYVGTHAYSPDAGLRDRSFVKRFATQGTYWQMAMLLLKRPSLALQLAESRLSEAGRQRPIRGNFDPSAGLPPFAESSSFAEWSKLKASLFEQHGTRYLAYALFLSATGLLLTWPFRRLLRPGLAPSIVALVFALLIEVGVASLTDGLDAARHFLVFSALGDVLLLVDAMLLWAAALRMRSLLLSRI
jgi:hypothetical protein